MWRVKLLLSTFEINTWDKFKLKASKVLQNTKDEDIFTYGMVRAALQVGPTLLEWNKDSLCIPIDVEHFVSKRGEKVVIALDLQWLGNVEVQGDAVKKLTTLIKEWNNSKTYDLATCNSQVTFNFIQYFIHFLFS